MSSKFVCDEMLQGVGRWLRAAGYDTLIAPPGMPDREVLQLAINSNRCLITRDVKINEMKNAEGVVLVLSCNAMPECLKEITDILKINWQYAPFTRCMLCNFLLQVASSNQRLRVPENARDGQSIVLYCPNCDKVYWEGGHVRRMRLKLSAYAKGDWQVGV